MRHLLKNLLACGALTALATGCNFPTLTPTQAGRNQTAAVHVDNRNGVIHYYGSAADTNLVNSSDGQRGGCGIGVIAQHQWIDTAGNEGGLAQTPTLTATQTTDVKPEIAAAWAGGSAGTGGAKTTSGVTEAALTAWQKLTSGQKLTAEEAKAITDCASGSCD